MKFPALKVVVGFVTLLLSGGVFLFFLEPTEGLLKLAIISILASIIWGVIIGLPDKEEWLINPYRLQGVSISRLHVLGLSAVLVGTIASIFLFQFGKDTAGLGWLPYIFVIGAAIGFALADKSEKLEIQRWELISLVLILLVASAFRFRYLFSMPYGAWYDEAQNTIVASRIWYESSYKPVFVPDLSQLPALAFYFFSPFAVFFGDNVHGVRLAVALAGLAAIVATWLLGRELFGRREGILAATLLAVMRWHVTFSRFGMVQIFTTLFIPLSLFFFIRSQRRGSIRDAVFCGITLGLGLQTYYSMVAIPLICLIIWLLTLIKRHAPGKSIVLMLVALLIMLITYAPVLQYAVTHWETFTLRMSTVAKISPATLIKVVTNPSAENLHAFKILKDTTVSHLGMFHLIGDGNGRHNLSGAPMLDPVTGFLLAIAFFWCLARCFEPRYLLLLLWFAASLAGGIFSLDFEAPQGSRTIGITPALALMAALPLLRLLTFFLSELKSKMRSILAHSTVIICLAFAAAYNWYLFFDRQLYDSASWAAYSVVETKIGELIRDEGVSSIIYVPEAMVGGPTEELIGGSIMNLRSFNRATSLPLSGNGKDAIVFVDVHGEETIQEIKHLYPTASFEDFGPPVKNGGRTAPIFFIVRISAPAIKHLNGWDVNALKDDKTSTTWHIDSSEFSWQEDLLKVHAKGVLRLSKSGNYILHASSSGQFSLRMDEAVILAGKDNATATLALPSGNHLVEIELNPKKGGGSFKLTWQTPKTKVDTLISKDFLFLSQVYEGGLLGEYFTGADCKGSPKMRQIDTQIALYFHTLPLNRPFSICWTGRVMIPKDGKYEFGTKSVDDSVLFVDGKEILKNTQPLEYNSTQVDMKEGWHDIELKYKAVSDYDQVYLYWKRPGLDSLEPELIPPNFLKPKGPTLLRGEAQ